MSDSRSTGIPLSVRNLRKSYDGRVVLQSLDLDIAAGEIFVLMGPSGSGKSVFLRHLIGLEAPDSGGRSWSEANGSAPTSTRRAIGWPWCSRAVGCSTP